MSKGTKTKVAQFRELSETISERETVSRVLGYDANKQEYIDETQRLIGIKKQLNDDITEYYEGIRFSRVGRFETVTEFINRMENTLETDDDGNVIREYFKLGISAIDDEFLDGKGVFSNSFIAIGADSGVGKTTLALNIISSLAQQDVQSQFFSFEMGDTQFFNEIGPQAKNKLQSIVDSPYADNLTLDFHSRDIQDLANSIQVRADEGVRAFVIDSYLSIYAGANEFTKMKDVVDMLATLKKELGVLIIIIAQISKSDSFNEVYDFLGGTTMKYESDVALFIRKVDGEEDTTKRHIHCEKNRVFEETAGHGIITEYNRETHKIEKLANFKEYGGMGADGKELKKVNFGHRK